MWGVERKVDRDNIEERVKGKENKNVSSFIDGLARGAKKLPAVGLGSMFVDLVWYLEMRNSTQW